MAFPTINPLLWRPVAAGLWSHRELRDGVFDMGDLTDALEYLDVKAENERRQADWLRDQQEGGQH